VSRIAQVNSSAFIRPTTVFQSLVLDKDLNTTENAQVERQVLGVPYGAVMVPLRNGAGDILGVVVAASDFSATRSSQGRSIILQALGALFAIVLLAGVILITIRGVLLRPLESIIACFAKLSTGDRSCQIPEAELLCDELKGLARQYEERQENSLSRLVWRFSLRPGRGTGCSQTVRQGRSDSFHSASGLAFDPPARNLESASPQGITRSHDCSR